MLTRTQPQDTKTGDVKQKVSCSISKNKQEIYKNYKENIIITTESINTVWQEPKDKDRTIYTHCTDQGMRHRNETQE